MANLGGLASDFFLLGGSNVGNNSNFFLELSCFITVGGSKVGNSIFTCRLLGATPSDFFTVGGMHVGNSCFTRKGGPGGAAHGSFLRTSLPILWLECSSV